MVTDERRHALVTGLCAMTFLLGFFIVGPSLAIFAFGFATTVAHRLGRQLPRRPADHLGRHARRLQAPLARR